ncbi:MAG: BLUF domain-containing protein [Amylibacter sp.]|nr:BLUF domain-containing protein [Amylibacter sp.]
MYVQTIYDSRARAHISDQDIVQITAKAQPYNIANGLTGFLYYDDWRFLQVIEGHPAQVAEVMKQITKDPIHHSVKVRLMNRTMVRSFGGWPFCALSASDPDLRRVVKLMGYNDLFETNVVNAIKVMKRAAGRKYRVMSIYEKEALFNVHLTEKPETRLSLTENMLGLRG